MNTILHLRVYLVLKLPLSAAPGLQLLTCRTALFTDAHAKSQRAEETCLRSNKETPGLELNGLASELTSEPLFPQMLPVSSPALHVPPPHCLKGWFPKTTVHSCHSPPQSLQLLSIDHRESSYLQKLQIAQQVTRPCVLTFGSTYLMYALTPGTNYRAHAR